MTESATGSNAELPVGIFFDLSPSDATLFEEICQDLLLQAGVDGGAFFEQLRHGRSFGEALGITPEITQVIYARAHRWFSVGRADRAEPLFRALCIADGKVADYWVGLGICLRIRKEWNAAALAFSTAFRQQPDWAVPAFHACELALASGDVAGAKRWLKNFRKLAGAPVAERPLPERLITEGERLARAIELRADRSEPTQ